MTPNFPYYIQISLHWWQHVQLPEQPPELHGRLPLCRGPTGLQSARLARLPREQVTPGWPHLERHGEGRGVKVSLLLWPFKFRSSLFILNLFSSLVKSRHLTCPCLCGLHILVAGDRIIAVSEFGWFGSALPGHCTSFGCESLFHSLFSVKWPCATSDSHRYPASAIVCCLVTGFISFLLIRIQLGTLHILEAMKKAGHDIRTLFFCGGLSKNPLFVQIHANATGMRWQESPCHLLKIQKFIWCFKSICDHFYQTSPFWLTGLPVVLPDQMEAVLLGAAVLGACASQDYSSIQVKLQTEKSIQKSFPTVDVHIAHPQCLSMDQPVTWFHFTTDCFNFTFLHQYLHFVLVFLQLL